MTYKRSLIWFRRDLRIADQTALHHAAKSSEEILPLFIQSDWTGAHRWTGPARQEFLCRCLQSLKGNLQHLGGDLICRRGKPLEVIASLINQWHVEAIFFNRDPDPHGRSNDEALMALSETLNIDCHTFKDHVLHAENEVLTKGSGAPYRVFTPYSRAWLQLDKDPVLPAPDRIRLPAGIDLGALPKLEDWGLSAPRGEYLEAGEKAARARLRQAVSSVVPAYKETRNTPIGNTTSRLSQDLRFGTLSIRTIFHRIEPLTRHPSVSTQEGARTFISELAWREFYMAILIHFPDVLEHEFNADWRALPWYQANESFEAWKLGETGFPIVDAGMRELRQTGFMHNRLRMITAMFLTKDLHLDWRLGEQYFMQELLDGEIASNNGGWQWSAGTGADAAPYFRIQNPWTQSKRFDPDGQYIKKWVPELRDLPAKALHEPPRNGPLATNYPMPMVDHAQERLRTLEIFKQHKR